MRVSFRELWECLITPFTAGLYTIVVWMLVPMRRAMVVQRSKMKAGPLSEVRSSRKLKQLTQLLRSASTQDKAKAFAMGIASGHLVEYDPWM